jgi:hypothetical protein
MNQSASAPSDSSAQSGRPISDDGTGFAITLVLVVAALIGAAAVCADFINQAG